MRALIEKAARSHSLDEVASELRGERGLAVLHSSLPGAAQGRYCFLTARPFLTFRSSGSRCELRGSRGVELKYGDPWRILDDLLSRYEQPDELDLPFPLGGCFGYWGYDLKNFLEPRLPRRAVDDLEFPECHVGFYHSLLAFDHELDTTWIIATGLEPDGTRSEASARRQKEFWVEQLSRVNGTEPARHDSAALSRPDQKGPPVMSSNLSLCSIQEAPQGIAKVFSNTTREEFVGRVLTAQAYIRAGDIYQVNLSHRLTTPFAGPGWDLFQSLNAASPAPFSAYLDAGDFQLVSSSPELFLRLNGSRIQTRPIKGTRPRSADPTRDSQLSYQLRTSPKEMAELVMITDLLRNDLGKVCEFGSIQVPELAQLERFAQVQHLVSTVEGALRPDITHLGALAACFPGGSITGAPKIRAMEIIDELETVRRGPYTGALGYLGFNRESQLSMIIRTALWRDGLAHFQVGAGIVADSEPESEYLETLAKARGFIEALSFCSPQNDRLSKRQICS